MDLIPNSMNRPIAEDPPGPAVLFGFTTLCTGEKKLTTLSPEDNVVLVWIISTFEKVEEEVFCSDIDVSGV